MTEWLIPLLNTLSDWRKIAWTHWDLEEKGARKQEFMKKNKLLQNVAMIQFSVLQTPPVWNIFLEVLEWNYWAKGHRHSLKATSKMKFQSSIKT